MKNIKFTSFLWHTIQCKSSSDSWYEKITSSSRHTWWFFQATRLSNKKHGFHQVPTVLNHFLLHTYHSTETNLTMILGLHDSYILVLGRLIPSMPKQETYNIILSMISTLILPVVFSWVLSMISQWPTQKSTMSENKKNTANK